MSHSYYSPWKAAHHPDKLASIRQGLPVVPASLQVDLEGYCPHRCVFCSYKSVGWQAKGMSFQPPRAPGPGTGLPFELTLALVDQMQELGIGAIELTGGGEPLAYPEIVPTLDALDAAQIRVGLITNGALLTPEIRAHLRRVAWVRFSLDAATPDTYARVHGVGPRAFEHTLDNISAYLDDKPPGSRAGASFVITPQNAPEIASAAAVYRGLGLENVRYTVTYEPSGTGWLGPGDIEMVDEGLARALHSQTDGFRVFGATYRLAYYSRSNTDFVRCHRRRFVWSVGTDGLVYPCCIQKYHPGFAMGSLHAHTLRQITEREAIRAVGFDVTTCKPCWFRDQQTFIDYLLEPEPEHKEFV